MDIIWYKLDNVADPEGNGVGVVEKGKTLEKCKEICNNNHECKSFTFGDGNCYLKDKCLLPFTSLREKEVFGDPTGTRYQTHHKVCHGNNGEILFIDP